MLVAWMERRFRIFKFPQCVHVPLTVQDEREREVNSCKLHDYSQTTVAIVHLHKSTMDSLKQVRWYLLSRRSIHTSCRSRLWYWPHLLPKFPPASLGPMVRTPLATAVDWVNVQIPSNHQSKLFWSGSTLQLWHLMMPSSSSSSSASLLLSLFSYIKCCMDRRNTLGPVATFATSKLGASTIQNCWKVLGPGPSGCPNGWFTVPVGAVNSWKFQQKQKLVQDPWR